MRKSAVLFCFAFTLTACTTMPSSPQTSASIKPGETLISYATPLHQAKPGNEVAYYAHPSLIKRPYRIIGQETISRYNLIGMERQASALERLMKNKAASMGGDAIIHKSQDEQKVEGIVISFEKVLL